MDENTKKELQSAAFDRLINHLRNRKDVQNKGIEISDPDARKHVYGMPYEEWKQKYQK